MMVSPLQATFVAAAASILMTAQPLAAANVVADKSRKWPGREIQFVLCEAERIELCRSERSTRETVVLPAAEAAAVREAVAIWNVTFADHIRFTEAKTPKAKSFVAFAGASRPTQCSTQRIGYDQSKRINRVRVGRSCKSARTGESKLAYSVIHEMMHVVGFFHEHQRADRGEVLAFSKAPASAKLQRAAQWRQPCAASDRQCNDRRGRAKAVGKYDFGSLMHYSLALPGNPKKRLPLTAKGNLLLKSAGLSVGQVGRPAGFSAGDISAIKALYPNRR